MTRIAPTHILGESTSQPEPSTQRKRTTTHSPTDRRRLPLSTVPGQTRLGVWATILVLLLALLATCHPPADRNQNFRLRKMNRAGWRLARGEAISSVLGQGYAGYDIGTALCLAAIMRTTMTPAELAAGPPNEAPFLYHVFQQLVFAIAVATLFAALLRLTTPVVAVAIVALLLLSPNWRFIAYSDDVYNFPLLAFAAALGGIATFASRPRIAWPAMIACALTIGVCCTFRTVSMLCLTGVIAVALCPAVLFSAEKRRQTRRRAAAFVVLAATCSLAPGALIQGSGHSFWHPMSCGLAEFGGHEDARARLYPWFVPEADLPTDATPINDWSDERSFRRVRAIDASIPLYSAEYEAIMRGDYFDTWRRYPVGMLRTYAARFMNVVTLNPMQAHTADSRITRTTTDTVAFAAFFVLLIVAWRTRLPRRAWFLLAAFAPMIVAPMIAHSGYIMYNAPARLPFYLFTFWTLHHVVRRQHNRARHPVPHRSEPRQ